MDSVFHEIFANFNFAHFPYVFISVGLLCILTFLLFISRRFESALALEKLGIPISLVIGAGGLFVGPYGIIKLLPEDVTHVWRSLPTPLLTLIFASLMIGRPLPKVNQVFKQVTNQALLALLLGFGQYLVGGIIVLFILIPYLGVDPLMGCLIEVGFEGGHGAAAVMGESFNKIGFSDGLDLGLAMATIGLLSSTLIGSALIFIGRYFGWIVPFSSDEKIDTESATPANLISRLKLLIVNIGLIGLAVLLGISLLLSIRFVGSFSGGIIQEVTSTFPVFPLALLGSLIVRYFLERSNQADFVVEILQREIGIISTDLLIITAMAGLDLPLLFKDWVPLLILSFGGLCWNLIGMFLFARICFKEKWFERSIIEFGNATGVAASGLLLLRLADPADNTNTLPIFSIKQLFLQPILSGGVITVIAPLAIMSFGLLSWTEITGVLTVLFILIALLLQKLPFFNENIYD